jgi:hypothetical protein
MVDARSGFVDDGDGLDGQCGEVEDEQPGGPSRANGRSRDVAGQAAPGERKSAFSFDKAMTKLCNQIAKSEEFFRAFKNEYNKDVERIKQYATDESLLSLWTLRVRGQKDPNAAGEGASDDDALLDTAEKIPLMKERLREAFADVMSSAIKKEKSLGRKEQIHFESSKRQKEKVILANSQVSALLELVPKGPEHCDALVAELQHLKPWLQASDDNSGGGGGHEGGENWDEQN